VIHGGNVIAYHEVRTDFCAPAASSTRTIASSFPALEADLQ
jgi:hypothetical protein